MAIGTTNIGMSTINVELGLSSTTANSSLATREQTMESTGFDPGGCTPGTPHQYSHFFNSIYACFIAGTKITMSDLTTKNIEDIVVDDQVCAYNPDKGTFEIKPVYKIATHENVTDTIIVEFSNGDSAQCTNANPFWIPGIGWCSYNPETTLVEYGIDCAPLEKGQQLLNKEEEIIEISNIVEVPTPVTVYSLKIKELENFIANGVVSHNKCLLGDTLIKKNLTESVRIDELAVGDFITPGIFVDQDVEILSMETVEHALVYRLTFDDDTNVTCSPDHPFYNISGVWCSMNPDLTCAGYENLVYCSMMNIGDTLQGLDTSKVITDIEELTGTFTTHTITGLGNDEVNFFANDLLTMVG